MIEKSRSTEEEVISITRQVVAEAMDALPHYD
jgi:hypothetical protein